jgi:hypothetical protein
VQSNLGLGEQLTLKHYNLRVDHAERVQLTAARESKVLHRIRKYCGISGVLKRSHQDKQCSSRFAGSPTDYFCKRFDLFSTGICLALSGISVASARTIQPATDRSSLMRDEESRGFLHRSTYHLTLPALFL